MSLKWGSQNVTDLKWGSTPVNKVMCGSNVVWQRNDGMFCAYYDNRGSYSSGLMMTSKDLVNWNTKDITGVGNLVHHNGKIWWFKTEWSGSTVDVTVYEIKADLTGMWTSYTRNPISCPLPIESLANGYAFFIGNVFHFMFYHSDSIGMKNTLLSFDTDTHTFGMDFGATGPCSFGSNSVINNAATDGKCAIVYSDRLTSYSGAHGFMNSDGSIIGSGVYVATNSSAVSIDGRICVFYNSGNKMKYLDTNSKTVSLENSTNILLSSGSLFASIGNSFWHGKSGLTNTCQTSQDGITWTNQSSSTDIPPSDILAYGKGMIIGISSSTSKLLKSTNGYNWETISGLDYYANVKVTYGT